MGKWNTAQKLAEQKVITREDELARERMKIENNLARRRNEEFLETIQEADMTFGVRLSDNDTHLRLDEQFWQDFQKNSTGLMASYATLQRELGQEKNKHDLKTLPLRLRHDAKMKHQDHKNSMERLVFWKDATAEYLSDPQKVMATVGLIGGGALMYYASKRGTKVAADYTAARLGKPKLVTETSRRSIFDYMRPSYYTKRLFSRQAPISGIKDVILPSELEEEMIQFSSGLRNTKKNNGYFTHSLLYGPPGTGKTLLARTVAKNADMDYAVLSGANILQYKKGEDKAQLNRLFDWDEANKKKTVIFLDEAEVVLPDREDPSVSEQVRELTTTLLARTGTESDKFALVFATNRPHVLDRAVLDRIDNKWEFPLPRFAQRQEMLELYIDKWVKNNPKIKKPITVTDLSDDKISLIAKKTDGFSGREISKLVIAWQQAAFRTSDNILDETTIDHVTAQKIKQHNVQQKLGAYLS